LDLAWLGGFNLVQCGAIPYPVECHSFGFSAEQDAVFTSTYYCRPPTSTKQQGSEGQELRFGSCILDIRLPDAPLFYAADGLDVGQYLGRVGYFGAHDATVAW